MTYPPLNIFEVVQVKFQTRQGFYPIKIKPNGYLGRPNINGNFVVWIKPAAGDLLVQVSAGKSVLIKSDEATRRQRRNQEYDAGIVGWHRLVFPTTYTLEGIICTKFARENDFRLLRLKDGIFSMFQVAVVSQNGRFYLFVTKQYEGQIQKHTSGIYIKDCPNLDPNVWRQLQPALKQLCSGKELPKFKAHQLRLDRYETKTSLTLSDGDKWIGQVRWWNPALHYGLLEIFRVNKKKQASKYVVNARIHESELYDLEEEPQVLCLGDLLKVDRLSTDMANTRGFDTRFKYEARGITVLKRGEVYNSSFPSDSRQLK